MNIKNAMRSTGVIAGIAGLVFALVYMGLEILNENPAATQSISIPHFPLIWLLASILFFCVLYAVGTMRAGKVRERAVRFGLSGAGAVLLGLFWLFPMLAGLIGCIATGGC